MIANTVRHSSTYIIFHASYELHTFSSIFVWFGVVPNIVIQCLWCNSEIYYWIIWIQWIFDSWIRTNQSTTQPWATVSAIGLSAKQGITDKQHSCCNYCPSVETIEYAYWCVKMSHISKDLCIWFALWYTCIDAVWYRQMNKASL